jgi:hypothetical protein
MKKTMVVAILAGVLTFGIVATSQANFITNGDFESGLTGWTQSGDVNLGTAGTSPLSGKYALLGYDYNSGTSSISQTFDIPDGTVQLAISFSYVFGGSDSSTSNYDTALARLRQYIWGTTEIDSQDILNPTSPAGYGQGTYSITVDVASWWWWDATTGNLMFRLSEGGSGTNSTFAIDNVSVYDPDCVSPVPEPMSLLLLGLGLLGIGAVRRKK